MNEGNRSQALLPDNCRILRNDKGTASGMWFEKGWKSLVKAVHTDGKLGYIQPVGAAPKAAGRDATDVYGVGAFLLAGSELYKLIK